MATCDLAAVLNANRQKSAIWHCIGPHGKIFTQVVDWHSGGGMRGYPIKGVQTGHIPRVRGNLAANFIFCGEIRSLS